MRLLNIVLLVFNIASFICVVPFAIFGVVEFFKGPEDSKKLLASLKISWSYRRILVVGFTCLAIFLLTFLGMKLLS